jgi:hypothetical protein
MPEEKEEIATSPEQLAARIAAREAQASGAAPEPIITEGAPAAETTPPMTPAGVPWIDEFNKTFGTQYKSVDEVKPLTELPNKLKEYQEKETSYKAFVEQEKGYKAKIAEYESSLNPLKYFSSPDAYIAEQLRIQHPDKNPILLQEIATADLKGMDDLRILTKSVLLEQPDLAESDVEEYLASEYGIDKDTPREEWSNALKTKIKIKAAEKRKELETLKKQITLPEVLTPEQLEAKATEDREKTRKAIEPFAEKFSQFDKFQRTIGDKQFEFVVPDEYKGNLKSMFETFFLAGNEVNETNLDAIQRVRDGQMLLENFDSVYRAIESDVEARVRKEIDKQLGNETPPNTATATDAGAGAERPDGFGAFIKSL